MSGGGGGGIIRRNSLRATFSDPLVSGVVPSQKQARLQEILAKENDDWTKEDEHFLLRCHADVIDAD